MSEMRRMCARINQISQLAFIRPSIRQSHATPRKDARHARTHLADAARVLAKGPRRVGVPALLDAHEKDLVAVVVGPLQEGEGALQARHQEGRGARVRGHKVHHGVLLPERLPGPHGRLRLEAAHQLILVLRLQHAHHAPRRLRQGPVGPPRRRQQGGQLWGGWGE